MGHHLRGLHQLASWTREPVGSPLPRVVGLWDFVLSDLNRRIKLSYSHSERLSADLDRFREASQAMPDGVIFLSHTDTIEWLNVRAEQQFGLDPKHDLGAPLTNLVRHPDFVRFLRTAKPLDPLVLHFSRPTLCALLVQMIPFGEDQKLVLSRDITQIEKLENMRRDFVANVSHELRTPLTVVSGFLETMADGLDDLSREDMSHFLALALHQAGRMQRLIEDLLALSALETGAPSPLEEDIDIDALLQDIWREAAGLSNGRHRVDVSIDSAGAVLHGSRKELYSAFVNLATNAVRYTPDGGEIRIAWQATADGAEFSVTDTGIGIAPEHLPRLTERFYRVDRGRSRETGGTGLGLAIVKHVLTRHHCELQISSEPGKGSRFCVRIPAGRFRA